MANSRNATAHHYSLKEVKAVIRRLVDAGVPLDQAKKAVRQGFPEYKLDI